MKNISLILILSSIVMAYSCSRESKDSLIYERLTACNSTGLDSTILCGTFPVFENRRTNSGRKINLNIVVIPAIHKNQSKLPIFCFDGGPGVAATSGASFYADSINYYRIEHDVVLIDVRGTGDSNPLHCRQLQFKESLEQQFSEMYPIQDVKDCFDSLSLIADLSQYTTTNMAIDVEEIRMWLGYNKINLFGLSFGGRLAQVYMKMFPNSIESCALWSPTTTSSKMPLYHAQYAEASLNKLFLDCNRDSLCKLSFPNIREEFRDLMQKGKAKSFQYKWKSKNGETKEVVIPWYSFHTKIRSLMYTPFGLRQIPYIIHQSYLENWLPFLSLFPTESSYDDFIAEGLYLCVTCTEDVPYITRQEADSLSIGTFMEDYRIQQQINACSNWTAGFVPDNFFEPVTSDIPTIVLSGYFDPITPPSMAEQIVKTLSNGYVITIPTMSHTFDGLSNSGCFDKIVVDFFNKPDSRPNSGCIELMLPDKYKTKE
ncbi:MAG: alpha/beta fold hydrolase [Saprospiraceae bacterium]|nr:alpha/beta fold hydrolase [Saprospiraceae bacterium]